MTNPIRLALPALLLSSFAVLPTVASAQLSGNVALTSDYKFRGQDQDTLGRNGYAKTSAFKPAVQGGFDDVFGDSGFYVGNWNSSVNWLKGNGVESDFYGGYKLKAGVFDLDFGALTYVYPGNSSGNTTELYGSAGYTDEAIGSFTLKYSHTVSKDYFGYAGSKAGSGLKGTNTGYLNLAYSKEVLPKLTLKAAVGYTNMSSDIRSLGYKSYVDYSVGASYDFGSGLTLTGAVQGANRQSAYGVASGANGQTYSPNKARVVVTVAKAL